MVLSQLTSKANEPLDLWLSTQHGGTRRDFVYNKKLWEALLANVPLFKDLENFEIAAFADGLQQVVFDNDDTIIKQGDEGDSFFVLEEGTAVACIDVNGEQKEVAAYARGGFFGELALLDKKGGKRKATIKTTSRCTCATLDRATFSSIVSTIEGLSEKFEAFRQEYENKTREASQTQGEGIDDDDNSNDKDHRKYFGDDSASQARRNAQAAKAVADAEDRGRRVEAAYAAASETRTSDQARKQIKPLPSVMPPPHRGTLQAPKARDIVPKRDEWESAQDEVEAKLMQRDRQNEGHGRLSLPFASSFGAPTVFVTKPPPLLICMMCNDVLLDPVLLPDGNTTCRKCAPLSTIEAFGGALPPDEASLMRIHNLPIMCAHALKQVDTGKGSKKWVLDEEGCRERVRFADRDEHEKHCTYRHVTCMLPGSHIPHHNCTMRLRFFQLNHHQQECDHRLVRCTNRGCGKFVQLRKLTEHKAVCYFAEVSCPNKHAGCRWAGMRGTMLPHMRVCDYEVVACGQNNTEDPTQSCPYRSTRKEMALHRTECEFRTVHCQFCAASVSAVARSAHEASCVERKQLCMDCGQMIPVATFAEHRNNALCARGGAVLCNFSKYGCTERLHAKEMAVHLRDDAHNHLRLVMHAVDTLNISYKEWTNEVVDVRDQVVRNLKATAEDMALVHKRVATTKESVSDELESIKQEIRSMRANHLSELAMLRTFIDNVRRTNDEKIQQLSRENEHLRELLQGVLTKDQLEELRSDLARFREDSSAQFSAAAADMKAREKQWAAETKAVRDAQTENAEWAESALEEVHTMMAVESRNEATRVTDLWNEVTALHTKAEESMRELRGEHRLLVQSVDAVKKDRDFMKKHEMLLMRSEEAQFESKNNLQAPSLAELEPIFLTRTGETPRPSEGNVVESNKSEIAFVEPLSEDENKAPLPSAMAAVDRAVAVEKSRRASEAKRKKNVL